MVDKFCYSSGVEETVSEEIENAEFYNWLDLIQGDSKGH